MKTIRLYGDMGKRFGRSFRLDVATPAEAIRALSVTRPGFREYLQERWDQPFKVLVGKMAVDEAGLSCGVGQVDVIKIVPLVAGAKDGFESILIGAALIAIVGMTGGLAGAGMFGSLAGTSALSSMAVGMGISMMLGGVAQLLAVTPSQSPGSSSADGQTWTFSSPTLTVGQGGCVPILLGEMTIGGVVMSSGIDAHAWITRGFGGMAPDDNGTQGGNGDTAPWVWSKSY